MEGDLIGRLVFELYSHLCPRTAANFAALCSGGRGTSESGVRLSYTNSVLHRVVPNGWIQGGGERRGAGREGYGYSIIYTLLSCFVPLLCRYLRWKWSKRRIDLWTNLRRYNYTFWCELL